MGGRKGEGEEGKGKGREGVEEGKGREKGGKLRGKGREGKGKDPPTAFSTNRTLRRGGYI